MQIDESLFQHKPDLGSGRIMVAMCSLLFLIVQYFQHHRGRGPSWEIWVFATICALLIHFTHQHWATWKLQDAATLLPIIQAHVVPGTVIHSDQWAAYNHEASLPNVSSHLTVNHTYLFIDPTTCIHTQNII